MNDINNCIFVFDLDGTIIHKDCNLCEIDTLLSTNSDRFISIVNSARDFQNNLDHLFTKFNPDFVIAESGLKLFKKGNPIEEWNLLSEVFCEQNELLHICSHIKNRISSDDTELIFERPNLVKIKPDFLREDLLLFIEKLLIGTDFLLIKNNGKQKIIHNKFNKCVALQFFLKDLSYQNLITAGDTVEDIDFVKQGNICFLSNRVKAYTNRIITFDKNDAGVVLLNKIFRQMEVNI